jgi:hypothetical protein
MVITRDLIGARTSRRIKAIMDGNSLCMSIPVNNCFFSKHGFWGQSGFCICGFTETGTPARILTVQESRSELRDSILFRGGNRHL